MITVFDCATSFCLDNNYPAPSKSDLQSLGNKISHHFKINWAPGNYIPGQIIPDCGKMFLIQGDEKFIVNTYPDIFIDEMIGQVSLFYKKKKTPIKTIAIKNIKRKRIPIK